MWSIAFFGAVAAAVLVSPWTGGWDPTEEGMPAWYFAFSAIVIAPPFETLAMAIFFGVAGFFSSNAHRLSMASALCWGALHLINAPVNAIAVVWPFYVMSRVYLAWRPLGFWKAFGVTMLIHAMINTVPALAVGLAAQEQRQLHVGAAHRPSSGAWGGVAGFILDTSGRKHRPYQLKASPRTAHGSTQEL
ncbi:MAG: hypothetical protein AMXMBFR7_51670 [Planctomycetota bacterium]